MSKTKKRNDVTTEFLLDMFFTVDNVYQVKTIGRWVIEKNIHGITGKPVVAIYTKDSFNKKREFLLNK